MKRCIILLALVCLNIASGFSQARQIPAFRFERLQSKSTFTEKEITAGKKSLFIFFDISCLHCQEAIALFNKDASRLNSTSLYLVTLDAAEPALRFLSQHANNFYLNKNVTLLRDINNEFIARFQPFKYPSIFLYSKTQKLELYSYEPADVPKFIKLLDKK